MKSKYRNIFLIFGIVAIVVMLCTFDMEYDELLANLRRAGIWLPAVIGLWVIIYLFNTLSWYIIIRDGKKGTPIPFWKVYKLTVSGFALNYATPVGLMAWRIAYCKVYYPLAYYAAYFSIRATGFNYEIMCQGRERLTYFQKDYERRKDSLSKKEQDVYRDMKIVQEMYARGFDFTPIDIYRAKPDRFQIIDGKLMPALNTIDGMGDNAAIAVAEAAKDGKFLSRDDFRQRTKATKTVIDLMGDLGLLGDMPESNQLSLFDFA